MDGDNTKHALTPLMLQAEAEGYDARFADYETLFQDETGEIEEPVGQTCDRLLCFRSEDAEDHSLEPCFFWLSVAEGEHYRFFVDDGAYIVQWFRADVRLLEQEINEDPDRILDLLKPVTAAS